MAMTVRQLLEEVVARKRSPKRIWLGGAFLLVYLAGALSWHALFGLRLEVLSENVSKWHEALVEETQIHHPQVIRETGVERLRYSLKRCERLVKSMNPAKAEEGGRP